MIEPRLLACLAFTLQWEGGWSDNPRDPGGATMQGITLATLAAWRHAPVSKADLRAIQPDERDAIYGAQYWNPVQAHDLPVGLDLMVFDHAVNSGPRASVMCLQRVAMTGADGYMGPATLAAVRGMAAGRIIPALRAEQERYYRSLPTFDAFGNGWLHRLTDRARASGAAMR